MFSRLNEGEQLDRSGIGLGLSICRGIVREFNGDVSVSSECGVGSTFTFDFDISEEVKEDEDKAAAERDESLSVHDDYEFAESRVNSETRRLFNANYGSMTIPSIQHSRRGCQNGQCTCPAILMVDDNNVNLFALRLILKM